MESGVWSQFGEKSRHSGKSSIGIDPNEEICKKLTGQYFTSCHVALRSLIFVPTSCTVALVGIEHD